MVADFLLINLANAKKIHELEKSDRWRIFCTMKDMMTRREVLDQLKRVGIKDLSLLKRSCRDFETYMAVHYGYEILKKGKIIGLPALPLKNPALSSLKVSLNLKHRAVTYPRLGFRASKG